MKILHIVPRLTKGGAERVAMDLANAAARDGHSVVLLCAEPTPRELWPVMPDPEVEMRTMYASDTGRLARYARLPLWVRRERSWWKDFDVVHCHLTFASAAGTFMAWQCRDATPPGRPVFIETNHGVGIDRRPHSLWLLARHLERRDGVAFMAMDEYWQRFQQNRSDLLTRLIPNGISFGKAPSADALLAQRKTLGIPEGARVVGTVGRMVAERQPRRYLPVFASLAETHGDAIHFVMGGSGTEIGPIRAIAEKLGFGDRFHCPGLVHDPLTMMGAMDCYVTVCVGENTGVAAMEAASIGVPVIGIQLAKGVSADSNEWLWSSPNAKEVAARCDAMLQSPAKACRQIEMQREFVWTRHSTEAMARAYYDLYRSAIACAKSTLF